MLIRTCSELINTCDANTGATSTAKTTKKFTTLANVDRDWGNMRYGQRASLATNSAVMIPREPHMMSPTKLSIVLSLMYSYAWLACGLAARMTASTDSFKYMSTYVSSQLRPSNWIVNGTRTCDHGHHSFSHRNDQKRELHAVSPK
jgi:hypothetical protein